ncbi:MAG: hypothetical protein V3U79_10215 [Dehalococcoidia bacterium]
MAKPAIGIDLDGVVCRPPLGLNIAIGRGPYPGSSVEPVRASESASPEKSLSRSLKTVLLRLKYTGRRPMADAKSGLLAIGEHRTLVLITSRNGLVHQLVESWLSKHGLLSLFEEVHTNDTGLPSPEFKWRTLSGLGIGEFVDDDGRVADLLSRKGLKRVYLRDWPRNRGYRYSTSVTRVRSLKDVARDLARTTA